MPVISPRRKVPAVNSTRHALVLPGVTAVVIIPHKQRRSVGGLARTKNGPELTIRMNELDKMYFAEGAKRCGLSMADYVRQCAVNMANAIRSQTDAPSFTEEG